MTVVAAVPIDPAVVEAVWLFEPDPLLTRTMITIMITIAMMLHTIF
jgi:hypothetical protein